MSNKLFTKELADIYAIATVDRFVSRKLYILYTIATEEVPTIDLIQEKTGIPIPSIGRIIGRLRHEDGFSLNFIRHRKEKGKTLPSGKTGHYEIEPWTNINPEEFLLTFPDASRDFVKP